MRRLRYWRKPRKTFSFINKDQHNSTDSTAKSIIGDLKQYDGSQFNYSTTMTESNWEPRGMLQPEQKIEDSANDEEMQRLQRLRRGHRRNNSGLAISLTALVWLHFVADFNL
ncbi:hypothetical protein B296_00012168 [Ensete ventricosum]|uniref:Uncharacterized protein n=1 Tax=Ensete ventricosum TaxID=4639 RepID=A0A427B5D2_ENSVE|nr:hypothetical protein B296_00012168 [Ensete ventricosum]